MLLALTSFAALSMGVTIILSILPEGGVKRTASFVLGLMTLLCWAEGIASLFAVDFPAPEAGTPLVMTALTVESVAEESAAMMEERWEINQ